MNGNVLLDTNAVIALLDNDDAVQRILRTAHSLYIAPAVLGELQYGSHISARPEANLQRIAGVQTETTVTHCTAQTASHYASIRAQLKRMGRPIPMNDIWIAASAIEHSLTLLTRDSHFEHIPGLSRIAW
ncbi:MAG: PIN domain-containing protein [Planctomycetes bacterium]|jgi:tRNA(fMet)-specific endonuclease VapC|nr:PIN domain-containing protein [Planctomycetota bacterium]